MTDLPTYDPAIRRRAHVAMTHVYYAMKDILTRYYDEDGMYREPSEVSDAGDTTGMIRAANNEVLRRLDDEVITARSKLTAILDEFDQHKRELYGPGYNPPPNEL
ncbi:MULTISPECIES: hypothetical protein [unclassified Micromonospora]|uniref:hypothetical protein n=1 Tax=unclassified Micromonospora TaxID=2617518 RepID=UPI00098D60F6|nr:MULTISPECIES: hypothetical protein [unclassified Micromonospora]MDI5937934.1 hypothetical protein [Micromonospora sp. DH15]OON27059.1 hypothetical protein BSA16_34040 [Micromonospora sp. Rc5]